MDRLYRFDACARTVNVGNGDRSIQSDDGGVVQLDLATVERQDTRPVRGFVILRGTMTSRDGGLKMILASFAAGGGLHQVVHATRDHRLVPAGAILFLETQSVSLAVQSRWQTRAVQCQQRVHAGTITGWVLGQER